MILLIDNYDSFVYNLARHFERLGHSTRVVRNTEIDARAVADLRPDAVVISPGPCTPTQAGCSLEVVRALRAVVPMLGVCLGHQAMAEAFGGRLARAKTPMHGRTSSIEHDGRGVFADLPNPLRVCRYHSLVVDEKSLPECLKTSARSADGTIMAMRHASFPIVGVQFHPEAILTEGGYALLANFLRLSGLRAPPANRLPRDECAAGCVRPACRNRNQ